MKKLFVIVLLLAAAGALGWQIHQKVSAHQKKGGPMRRKRGAVAVAVEVEPVRKGVIRNVRLFTGSLLPKSEFRVAPKISGRLAKLLVDIGDTVKRGQLIAVLDDDEFVRQVEQARAELDVAKANAEEIRLNMALEAQVSAQQVAEAKAAVAIAEANVEENRCDLAAAKREFDRVKSLRDKQIVSEGELDAAEDKYNAQSARHKVMLAQVAQRQVLVKAAEVRTSDMQSKARAAKHTLAASQVTQKEAALKAAEVRRSYTQMSISWEDADEVRCVGGRFVDEGAMLTANAPVVSILQTHPIVAEIHVIERDYVYIEIGQEAAVTTDAHADRTFAGQVARITPQLEEASRQARIEIEIDNSDKRLRPGMFVRVRIELARHDEAMLVPVSALAKREGKRGVFLMDEESMKANFVPVKLGFTEGDLAEVLEPALSGSVITLGHHLLEDGGAITLPGAAARGKAPPEGSAKNKAGDGGQ